MAKRKEIIFEITDVYLENGLTWDELSESILPIIELMLEDFKAYELKKSTQYDCKYNECLVR